MKAIQIINAVVREKLKRHFDYDGTIHYFPFDKRQDYFIKDIFGKEYIKTYGTITKGYWYYWRLNDKLERFSPDAVLTHISNDRKIYLYKIEDVK